MFVHFKKTQDISLKERSWRCSQATFLCWREKKKRSRSFFYSKNSWDFPITTWPRNLRETPRVCGGPVRLCHRGGEGNSAEPAKQRGGVSKADLPLTLSWGLWHSLAVLRAIQPPRQEHRGFGDLFLQLMSYRNHLNYNFAVDKALV